jgi:hypothetical protein
MEQQLDRITAHLDATEVGCQPLLKKAGGEGASGAAAARPQPAVCSWCSGPHAALSHVEGPGPAAGVGQRGPLEVLQGLAAQASPGCICCVVCRNGQKPQPHGEERGSMPHPAASLPALRAPRTPAPDETQSHQSFFRS